MRGKSVRAWLRSGRLLFAALPLVVGIFAFVALASPTAALACSPGAGNHCYGIGERDGTAYGGFEKITVTQLAPSPLCSSGQFTNAEMWVSTDNDNVNYWVEAGEKAGYSYQNGCYSLVWFWADVRPSYGYAEHETSLSTSLSTAYQSKIVWAGSNSWNLYRDGYNYAVSTSNPCCSPSVQAGEEISAYFGDINGTANNLQYADSGGTWHSWNSASIHATTPWATAGWGTYPTDLWYKFHA